MTSVPFHIVLKYYSGRTGERNESMTAPVGFSVAFYRNYQLGLQNNFQFVSVARLLFPVMNIFSRSKHCDVVAYGGILLTNVFWRIHQVHFLFSLLMLLSTADMFSVLENHLMGCTNCHSLIGIVGSPCCCSLSWRFSGYCKQVQDDGYLSLSNGNSSIPISLLQCCLTCIVPLTECSLGDT